MKNKFSNCNLDFSIAINKMTGLIMDGLKRSPNKEVSGAMKEYVTEAVDNLKAQIKEVVKNKEGDTIDALAADVKDGVRRQIIDLMNTYKAVENNIDLLKRQLDGATDIKTMQGALTSLYQRTHELTRMEKTWFDNLVENAFDNLATQGARSNPQVNLIAKELFLNHAAGGDKLMKYLKKNYGVEDFEKTVFMSLKQGTSDIPVLDRISAVLKELDGVVIDRARTRAPYLGVIEGHIQPLKYDNIKIETAGFEQFAADMAQLVNTKNMMKGRKQSPEALKFMLREVYDNAIQDTTFNARSQFKTPIGIFAKRNLHFKSAEAEFEFIRKYGNMDQGVLGGFLGHRQNLLKKTAIHESMGPDVGFTVFALQKHLQGLNKDNRAVKQIIDKTSQSLESIIGGKGLLTDNTELMRRAASQYISASLTGKSAVRNVAYDLSGHSGLVQSMLDGEGAIAGVAKAYWGLFSHMARRGHTKELTRIFEDQGIAIKVSQGVIAQGLLEDMSAAALSRGGKVPRTIEKISRTAIEGVSKYGGADWTNRSARAYHTATASRKFLHHLEDGYETVNDVLKGMLKTHGIEKAEFNLLKKFDRLRYSGDDIGIDVNYTRDTFERLKPDLAKLRRPLESDKDVLNRISRAYSSFMLEKINEIAAIPTLRGQMYHGKEANGWIALVNTGAVKFSNIALSQWYAMYRASHRAAGLNPNIVGTFSWKEFAHIGKNPVMFGRMVGTMAAGGMAGIWIKDILDGKTPRDIDRMAVFNALSQNGLGGILSIAANTFVFDDDIVATPVSAFYRAGKQGIKAAGTHDPQKKKRAAYQGVKRAIPGTDLWYTSLATKQLFRKGVGMHPTRQERRAMRKRGQHEFVD